VLKADIQKAVADTTRLAKEIAGHDEDISVWQGDQKAATKVREIEKVDYDAMHKDYSESIDALQKAVRVLKAKSADHKQTALVELAKLTLIPKNAKQVIDNFLQQDPEDEGLAISAPEANAYEFQSGKIISMLEKLEDKFIEERTTLEHEESNARHAYELLMQDLTAQVEQAKSDSAENMDLKAATLQSKADAEGDLKDTTTTLNDDSKYATDLTSTCEQKASDFESRQQLRSAEIQTIENAIALISSEAVAGNAEKHLPSMLQNDKRTFAQLRSSSVSPLQLRVADFLRGRAHQINSRILSALVVRVSNDPFGKVKRMIKDLIVRLMEEANEEAEHKGWCDTELSTNEQTRKEKTTAVELLHAEIDELEASITKLSEDITELSSALADLDRGMAEATKIRQAEKEKNAATIKDANDAQMAVAQAILVLKEFYVQAAEATAFIQQPEMPSIFESPYKGMKAESGGIIGMLEVIESDFARLEAETDGSEAAAESEYDQFMTDSKVDKAAKGSTLEHKTAKRQDEEQALTTKKADLDGTQKELDAALAYFDKLKPSCVDSGTSYDDRVSRRKEEIESLQEALKILNGEDIG